MDNGWRYTTVYPAIGLDVRAYIPLAIFVVSPWKAAWMFYLALIVMALFAFMAMKGLSPMIMIRRIIRRVSGRTRLIIEPSIWRRRVRPNIDV